MRKLLSIFLTAVLAMPACASRIEKEINSTVLIHIKMQMVTPDGIKTGWGTCTGVYVKKNEILTAAHCIGAMEEDIQVKDIWIGQENGNSSRAEVIRVSVERDLCLLRTSLKGKPVHLAHYVRQGESIVVVGQPLRLPWIVTTGIVSQTNFRFGKDNPTSHFVISAIVLPGNSGGPCFDSRGKLLGIVVRSTSMLGFIGASGLGFAVDIHEIKGFLGGR